MEYILDSEGRLQLLSTGKYIIDKNYTTFLLSSKEISVAEKIGLVKIMR